MMRIVRTYAARQLLYVGFALIMSLAPVLHGSVDAQTRSLPPSIAMVDVAKRAIGGYFEPGYRKFMLEARSMLRVTESLCHHAGRDRLDQARKRFGSLSEAWARVAMVRFGPVLQDHRLERIQYWPDRRGRGLRQIQAILVRQEPTATDPIRLADKSIAVQGLGALEFVLFGSGSEDLAANANSFRCRYALAIIGNLAKIAGRLHTQWTAPNGIVKRLTLSGPENPDYQNAKEVLNQIVGVLAHGFELIRDTRLNPMLGAKPKRARPKAALYWRSGLTIHTLRANFAGLRKLFETSNIGGLLPAGEAPIVRSVQFEFGNLDRALQAVTLPIQQAVVDPDQRGKLTYAVILSQSLQKLIRQDLSLALGLTIGFSSADGD